MTTRLAASNMELHALSTGRELRVATVTRVLRQTLFRCWGGVAKMKTLRSGRGRRVGRRGGGTGRRAGLREPRRPEKADLRGARQPEGAMLGPGRQSAGTGGARVPGGVTEGRAQEPGAWS